MLKPRPPIVTILGHVDHGKTTLLDSLRKSNVAVREAGGITQSIGASVVITKDGRRITFIDTPGHAAFAQMRSRGASACDIAVLIVAADDGVKPQTKEAIEIILKENIPFIVCLTKTDLQSADPDSAKDQLEKAGVLLEEKGGKIPYLEVSAKKDEGLEGLLEMILLLSDMNEIKADPDGSLDAFVVETKRDNRGSMASIVVMNGRLKVGEKILIDGVATRVRGLFDHTNNSVKEIFPGEPALILGFDKMPAIGAKICGLEGAAQNISNDSNTGNVVENKKDAGDVKLNLVIKSQSSGCLEALLSSIPEGVHIISSGVGEIIEADIFAAKSAKNCRLFAFEVKVPVGISKLADTEGVKIESFDIIYKLIERLDEILKEGVEEILGKAEIIAAFPFENRKVAGCKVIQGKIGKDTILKLIRNEIVLGEVKATSMKKEKKDITEAKQGEEFGVIFQPQLDFVAGDMVVSVRR
ncbi:MAG: Translation initiation factor IF-2 [Candidatus Woesebacteria bacterium GW2011_GWD1_38_10]|uniref:Translation initiation factor IF-2 n=1 Tax=Candidatus Woesebacteria bacterium GW2011_GWD1_38_10 TaxID=1618592 RepID=A0A0G0HU94_9BACT|nr:MAG: Translation initiation factor IF-2 [Candidatus Woesebacteria bacterium GW2011_GWD1_38_10]